MTHEKYFTLVSIKNERPEEKRASLQNRKKALGILSDREFVDGDISFLNIMGKSAFPFSVSDVFREEDVEKLYQASVSHYEVPFYFKIVRDEREYMGTAARLNRSKKRWYWFIEEYKERETGKPIVGLEQRYRNLFENLKDAVFASTVEGKFIDINPAGVEMLGYSSKEEVLKLNILTDLYYYPEDRLRYQETIAKQGYVKDYEVVFKKKDRTPLFVSMTNIAVYDEDRKILGYEGVFRDLTRQKKIEEELRRKNAQLESYVYTVSHDLKSPIIAIQGFARLLARRCGKVLDDKAAELLNKIMDVAKRAERMLMDLLAYSRAEKDAQGDFEFIDTYQVIQSIIEELRVKWEGRFVNFVVSEDLPEILFHPNSFRQIMSNLIDNAIKYSQQAPSSDVVIGCKVEEDSVVFSVEDNGIGIDPAMREKIFDVFERGDAGEEIEGTGIGLSIIKRIIETHHGEIWFDSEKGRGTTFYVRLPVRTLKRKHPSTSRGEEK